MPRIETSQKPMGKKKRAFRSVFLYILLCLLIGFMAGELMGVILVARSNRNLLTEQQWLEKNGYIAVPGTALSSEMASWKTYLAGGLFFGLSVGVCYAFIWGLLIWGLSAWPKIRIIATLILFWLSFSLFLFTPDWNKFWPFGLFILFVPFLVFLIFPLFNICKDGKMALIKAMPYLAGFLGTMFIVYSLMAPSLTSQDFIRIRDGFFGRTNWGRSLSDFYYHYTLYPARVIKTFDQGLQRFLKIEPDGFTENEIKRIKNIFLWRDIFIGKDAPSHTVIKKGSDTGNILLISNRPPFRIEWSLDEFITDPNPMLKAFQGKADSASFLRRAVGWSLFETWPFMGVFLVYSFLLFLCNLMFKNPSPIRDALLAFFIALVLTIALRSMISPNHVSVDTETLLTSIAGKGPIDRITAIMTLSERMKNEKTKARPFSEYFIKMLDDPDPMIRKWGIDLLTLAGEKRAIRRLIGLLNDHDPNIAYHAARSLGNLRAREAREPLLKVLKADGEWYLKTTAYISLREIGWSQLAL
jgi:hypothetical protein